MHTLLGIMLLVLLGTMQPKAPAKACSAPENRQFDFWAGLWEVHNAKGELAGRNRIAAILSGCALQEHWEGSKGMTGTSINFYDRADGRWHQTWVDTEGTRLELAGSFVDGKMVLTGESPKPRDPGRTVRHRITWSPLQGGRVRQLWESSPDEGRTWTTVFDGTYTRVSPGE